MRLVEEVQGAAVQGAAEAGAAWGLVSQWHVLHFCLNSCTSILCQASVYAPSLSPTHAHKTLTSPGFHWVFCNLDCLLLPPPPLVCAVCTDLLNCCDVL